MLDKPIFVCGFSRSGGTLIVTMLDAHPAIAMSYELYPDLLTSLKEKELRIRFFYKINIDRIIKVLKKSKNMKSAVKNVKDKDLRTFFLRCLRGYLDNKDIARLLQQHIDEGQGFSNVKNCLKFIERCGIEKMKNKNKSRWGLKCTNQFYDYVNMWPNAYFLNIIRDGRDVLASQLNTGSFNKNIKGIAEGWVTTHMRFRELVEHNDINAYEVFYEKLVNKPEEETRKICDFLNVAFEKSMLKFYEQDLSIYAGPAGHLSLKRISKPIDNSMAGRWKKDLNKSQLEDFYSVAGDAMFQFGYLGVDEC
jgi:hypothetical protein